MCYYTRLMCLCVCVCVFSACDDDCAGLLIRDMDRLLRLIGSVNLTLPLPLPYKSAVSIREHDGGAEGEHSFTGCVIKFRDDQSDS